MTTIADLAARAAGELSMPPDDPRVAQSMLEAVDLATDYVYGARGPWWPAPDQAPPATLDLEKPSHQIGLVALAVYLYTRPRSPGGTLESDGWTGDVVNEDPMAAVHHYFDRARDVSGAIGLA